MWMDYRMSIPESCSTISKSTNCTILRCKRSVVTTCHARSSIGWYLSVRDKKVRVSWVERQFQS